MNKTTGDFLLACLHGFQPGTQILLNREAIGITQFRFPDGRLFWLLDHQWEARPIAAPETISRPPAGTRVRVSLGEGEVVEWADDIPGGIKVRLDIERGEFRPRYEWTTNFTIL